MKTNLQWQKQISGSLGRGGKRVTKEHRDTLGTKKMFTVLIVVSWVHTYVKIYQVAHFKYVQFIVCQLYLNKAINEKYNKALWNSYSDWTKILPKCTNMSNKTKFANRWDPGTWWSTGVPKYWVPSALRKPDRQITPASQLPLATSSPFIHSSVGTLFL